MTASTATVVDGPVAVHILKMLIIASDSGMNGWRMMRGTERLFPIPFRCLQYYRFAVHAFCKP